MDDKPPPLWNEMLGEFRALGGTADNVRLGEGSLGRGLFPIDPARPIKVHIPESLLPPVDQVEFVNDVFRIKPDFSSGERERNFLESYERDFSWGVSRQSILDLLQMMHEAPLQLREHLRKFCRLWMAGPTPEAVQERFLASRAIRYNDQRVLMPITELANHGEGIEYDFQNGIGLSGQFAGEIFVRYRLGDPLRIFANWGFASAGEPLALSMGVERPDMAIGDGDIDVIDMKRPFFPKVTLEGGQLKLSYLMLGNRKFPRLARGIFRRIMQDAGRPNADEQFDWIQHHNRTAFYNLLELSELAAPPLGRLLRTAIVHQLRALSHNIGSRPV
jgi:hypothetical protein